MSTSATGQKVVPLIGSRAMGPLGVAHLPRLWTKLTLHHAGVLPEGYDHAGAGFDQMTLDALGLDREETIAYVKEKHPTYMQFEKYVTEKCGGSVPKDKIDAHNKAVLGYNHSDELSAKMQKASGAPAHVKDAVTLNMVEDLDELHGHIHGSH
ncbi:MAG: hypothetical protein NVS2B8_20410 [Vulcanimicrobiaceae bacterium]